MAADILTKWSPVSPVPYQIANESAFIDGNTINIIAGSTFSATPNVSYTTINDDGSLSGWNTTNIFPTATYWHSIAKKDNFVYIIGGTTYPPANSQNSVYISNTTNGIVGNWKQTNPLPMPNSLGGSIILNNNIYSMGGFNMINGSYNSFSDAVYKSDILTDNTISDWTQLSSLPKKLFGFGIITIGNKIIIIGGRDESNTSISNIYEANALPDGSLSPWIEISNLPQPVSNAGIVLANNTIYVVGGANITQSGQVNWLNTIYFASIENNGTIGTWNTSQFNLPKTICCSSLVASNTHLYLIGGYDGTSGTYISDVFSTTYQNLPVPTPLPSLDVPDIKQYSAPWNSQIYDHSNLWSNNPTIERWGCALTSANMVLNYYGFQTDPGILNNWLNKQQDGYIRNGLLNWLAISRYSKINSNGTKPSLEFLRLENTQNNLINELKNNRPAILEEPGHYVVAKSQTIDSFKINDPGFSDKLTLDSYKNTFNSIESYVPSHTDLSYIMLVVDQKFNIKIYDINNIEIKNSTFDQAPINDNLNSTDTSGPSVKIVMFPKPNNGSYSIQISGLGSYQLDTYLYDTDGNVTNYKTNGLVSNNNPDEFQIKIGDKNSLTQIITIDSIINDWKNFSSKKNPITTLLLNSKKFISKGNIRAAKITLKVASLLIQGKVVKTIDIKTIKFFQTEISTLISTL